MNTQLKIKEEIKNRKLILGATGEEKEDFIYNSDLEKLLTFPWDIEDSSIEEVTCTEIYAKVPRNLRYRFIEELYRVLVPGGKASITTPYYKSVSSIQDFSYEWPPISEQSYLYTNKKWREENKKDVSPYPVIVDFDFTINYSVRPPYGQKAEEARNFALTHYWEVISDMQVVLIKREGDVKK